MPRPSSSQAVSTDTDERFTPFWVLDLVVEVMGGIDLDPCADPRKRVPATRHFTKEDDGLEQNWSGRVFLNPPFSCASSWVQHLTLYLHTGSITEAMLFLPVSALSNKTSTAFMRSLCSAFVIFERDLGFLDGGYKGLEESNSVRSGPFALAYSGPSADKFLRTFSPYALPCLVQQRNAGERQVLCQFCGKSFIAKRSTAKFCDPACRVAAHRIKNLKR